MFDLLPNNGGMTIRLGLDLGVCRALAQPSGLVVVQSAEGALLRTADNKIMKVRND